MPFSARIITDTATGLWITAADRAAAAGETRSAQPVEIPPWAEPGGAYYWGGAWHLTALTLPLQAACDAWHNAHVDLRALLRSQEDYYPDDDVRLTHDVIQRGHPTAYLIAHDTTRSRAQKLAWFAAAAQGPQGYDPTNPPSFMDLLHTVTPAHRATFRALAGSISPVAMAPPHGRLTVVAMLTTDILPAVSATEAPAPATLRDGAWIRALTE